MQDSLDTPNLSHPYFFDLFVHRLPDLGPVGLTQLLAHFDNTKSVCARPLKELQAFLSPSALEKVGDLQTHAENSKAAQQTLSDLQWFAEHEDASLLKVSDAAYPALLRETHKAPPLLFVRGNVVCLNFPQLGIVGSRNPSSGGIENAMRFAEFLAAHGFAISSGLALGIDAAAHQGALNVSGKTLAVMGTGIDKIYPSRHQKLATAILDQGGALISELPLGSAPQAANFPQRNRIISGLSCGILVVEAALKSGSLITAQTALTQNREVFAIPGSIHNPLVRGCHQLIRQGATLVETAQDIVDQLGGLLSYQSDLIRQPYRSNRSAKHLQDQTNTRPTELSDEEQKL